MFSAIASSPCSAAGPYPESGRFENIPQPGIDPLAMS
jgi:hypothetical protein